MKNNKGFISILSLLLLSLVIIIAFAVEYSSSLRYMSLNSYSNNIQSYYLAEGKIYMSLSEKEYYNEQLYVYLSEYFRRYPFSTALKDVIIKSDDLMDNDTEANIKVNILDTDSLKKIQLISKSNYNKSKSTVMAYGKIFNEIFYLENLTLSKDRLQDSMKIKYESFLDNLNKNISTETYKKDIDMYYKEIYNYNEIYLHKSSSHYEMEIYKDGLSNSQMDSFTKNEVFIVAKSSYENTSVVIGEYLGDDLSLSGVMYVEGDLNIKSDFQFNGILILKNGSIYIENNVRFKFRGVIIGDNINNYEFLEKTDIIYSRDFLYKYCSFIPGIIDVNIDLIKSE